MLTAAAAAAVVVTVAAQRRALGGGQRIHGGYEIETWEQGQCYARSWLVLCPATEKIGSGAGTCLSACDIVVSHRRYFLTQLY